MPYKQDFIAALLAAKEQGIGAILAFIMAYLRGRYNGGAMAKTLIDAVMCAMIAWFIRDLLDFIGLSSNLAYIASVFIGYIGTDSIGNLIKKFAARKAGLMMLELNKQRRAFLDMLAWSEGTDKPGQNTKNRGYDVIVGGSLFSLQRPPTKTGQPPQVGHQIYRGRALPAAFKMVGCVSETAWIERLLTGLTGPGGTAANQRTWRASAHR
jgi:lambda family phage holin